ncbi:hypothetical protein [Pinisolibacter aquiterrae]|uniref:hypothetical protein n=1 Tax=Pinisolibacter aquiterrae TaxID=2815579 RepID=UPI001C3D7341|nr:hypothetical protein [Pinisolibacter aquiterrae]MBV5266435.1 hypothetical protein [Pinisolibacter aquiterrae]MCC8234694.1 hypothetical protein [Pinisolibacter aquiterrae]
MKSAIPSDPEPKWMRKTRITLEFFAAFCVIYPTINVLIPFDQYYMLPKGAVLVRVFDWKKWSRIDLLRSWDGELLVRDVDDVCFDRKAIEGTTVRSGSFVWLGEDAPPTRGDDRAHKDVLRESGLNGDDGRCLGYFGSYLGAELLLRYPEFDWQRAEPDEKPRSRPHSP